MWHPGVTIIYLSSTSCSKILLLILNNLGSVVVLFCWQIIIPPPFYLFCSCFDELTFCSVCMCARALHSSTLVPGQIPEPEHCREKAPCCPAYIKRLRCSHHLVIKHTDRQQRAEGFSTAVSFPSSSSHFHGSERHEESVQLNGMSPSFLRLEVTLLFSFWMRHK